MESVETSEGTTATTVKSSSNRVGRSNYCVDDHVSLLNLIEEKKKFAAGGKDKIWQAACNSVFPGRSPDVVYKHFRDMTQAMKAARSTLSDSFPASSGDIAAIEKYYKDLHAVIKSDTKKYYAASWWNETVVQKLCTMQMADERLSSSSKIQDADTLEEMKTMFDNKYQAEQLLRNQELKERRDKEKEREQKESEYKSSLLSTIKELSEAIKVQASPIATTPLYSQVVEPTTQTLIGRVSNLESEVAEVKNMNILILQSIRELASKTQKAEGVSATIGTKRPFQSLTEESEAEGESVRANLNLEGDK